MGSFAFGCCVSGLPIEYGDKVRYLMLTQNPYQDSIVCYMGDIWFPRVCPLKATYNDYGSVENIEEGPAKDVWMEGFQNDLVERGVGDNSCHDVAVSKDMKFEQLLEALWERRVLVTKEQQRPPRKSHTSVEYDPPDYIPSILAINQVLSVFAAEGKSFLVDDEQGYYRVREAGYGAVDEDLMFRAKVALENLFSVATCAGSGNYANSVELRVFMRPGNDGHGHSRIDRTFYKSQAKPTLEVRQAMIREDVWQGLLKIDIDNFEYNGETDKYENKVTTYADYLKDMKTYFTGLKLLSKEGVVISPEMAARLKESGLSQSVIDDLIENRELGLPRRSVDRELKGTWITGEGSVPGGMSIGNHVDLLLDKGPLPESYIEALAEFAYVHAILQHSRYNWQPSHGVGPQCGEWEMQKKIVQAFNKVCTRAVAQRKRERAE